MNFGLVSYRLAIALAAASFATSLILFGLNFGLAAGWHLAAQENKFLPIGWNPYQNAAVTYLIIAISYLGFFGIARAGAGLFRNFMGLVPLIIVILQYRVLLSFNVRKPPRWVTDYSQVLELLLYGDALIVVLVVLTTGAYVFFLLKTIRASKLE